MLSEKHLAARCVNAPGPQQRGSSLLKRFKKSIIYFKCHNSFVFKWLCCTQLYRTPKPFTNFLRWILLYDVQWLTGLSALVQIMSTSCRCRLPSSGRRRAAVIFQRSGWHSFTLFSHSVNTAITCNIWTGDINQSTTWTNTLDITHLRTPSGDSPASLHTAHKPEEASLQAVNMSEKKRKDGFGNESRNKREHNLQANFQADLPVWHHRVNWVKCEVDSRSGGPCSQPVGPLRPSLQGHTPPAEHQQSAARALRSDRNSKSSARNLNTFTLICRICRTNLLFFYLQFFSITHLSGGPGEFLWVRWYAILLL